MDFDTTTEVPEFELPRIEEGMYVGELEKVEEFQSEYGPTLSFIYKVEGTNVKLKHLSSIPSEVHPETKLGKIFLAHGKELGQKINTDDLIGTKVRLIVEDVKKKDKDGNEVIFSGVTKVKKLESSTEQAA